MRNVKLQEVAERAGVSTMTVSLALRGGAGAKRMSATTRERVLEAAKELRYFPDARARALRLGRTNVIGLYAGHGFVNVRSPFFTEIVSGLQEGCEQIRKDLLLHGAFHGSSSEDVLLELLDGRIDGLVVSMPPTDPIVSRLASSSLSVVAIADALPDIPSITVDDAQGSRLVAEHLAAKGHRRVFYVMSPAQPTSALRRRDAFLESADELGMTVAINRWHDDSTLSGLIKHAVKSGITALACWNDDMAHMLAATCRQVGIKVPEDLAITGFDGCPAPYVESYPLTTIAAPWAEAARLASLSLDALLKGETVEPEIVLPVRLVPGCTT